MGTKSELCKEHRFRHGELHFTGIVPYGNEEQAQQCT